MMAALGRVSGGRGTTRWLTGQARARRSTPRSLTSSHQSRSRTWCLRHGLHAFGSLLLRIATSVVVRSPATELLTSRFLCRSPGCLSRRVGASVWARSVYGCFVPRWLWRSTQASSSRSRCGFPLDCSTTSPPISDAAIPGVIGCELLPRTSPSANRPAVPGMYVPPNSSATTCMICSEQTRFAGDRGMYASPPVSSSAHTRHSPARAISAT